MFWLIFLDLLSELGGYDLKFTLVMHTIENTVKKIHLTLENGLVFRNQLNKSKHISERYHIQEKAVPLEATAVLFRRKYNEHGDITDSKPSLYIYQKENDFFNSQEHRDLHAKIWSAGDIEVYIIISATRIDIINARKPAEVKNDGLDVENLRLISDTLEQFNDQRFSALEFGNGTFWEQADFFDPQKDNFYKNQLKEENAPFYQLLKYLMFVREHLHTAQKGLSPDTIDKLLIVCILVKFLEEIKDDGGKHTLRDIYKNHNIEDFAKALEKGICLSILNELSSEFNGNIFDNFSNEEKLQIQETDLSLIADFLRANIDLASGQYFLWQQYSFNYLPVELISAIYESFLPKEKGVVYTPPFLVNFLIDEVMPLDKAEMYFSQNQFKVLDPSCGSGVFLVAAYKRMLQWWSINDYRVSNKSSFSKPSKVTCQEILESNIFGVDIHPTATLISIFSLTIALLDRLEPKEIWNNLKLHTLQENIQTQNFFEWATDFIEKNKKFDLVIGNPPFNPIAGATKKDVVTESQIQQFGISNKDIPRNSFALKFFEGAMFLGRRTCLILPSSILLYDKTAQKYRTRIFTQFTIEKIFDFTHLREVLFVKKFSNYSDDQKKTGNQKKTGRTPVSAIVANSEKSQRHKIEHVVVKRLASIEKSIFLEIDHYDHHPIPHNWAIDPAKQFIWKTNLFGGGRLFHLIYRLSLLPTLRDFIADKEDNEWVYSIGYIVGGSKDADFITDKLTIKPRSFKGNGEFRTKIEPAQFFSRPRQKELYTAPHIIFKLVIEKLNIPLAFSDEYLCFNSSFVGIHAPLSDRDQLYEIYDRLHRNEKTSSLYQAFILATTSKAMIYHETSIVKDDIDNLPYPAETEYLTPSPTEEFLIKDVLSYYIHSGKAISKKGEGKKLHEKVTKYQLEQFGQIFCDTLNPIYAKNGKSWQYGNFYQTNSFTICQFGFGPNKGLSFQVLDKLDEIITPLIYNSSSHRGAVFTRVCRIYKHIDGYDCVFLIKPSAIRYWLNSIALRDADETFVDLKQAGR